MVFARDERRKAHASIQQLDQYPPVATCTGLPDSFASHAFNSSGVVSTYRALTTNGHSIGRPSLHGGGMTEVCSDLLPAGQRGLVFLLHFSLPCTLRHSYYPNNWPCGGASNSTGSAHSASSFSARLIRVLTG